MVNPRTEDSPSAEDTTPSSAVPRAPRARRAQAKARLKEATPGEVAEFPGLRRKKVERRKKRLAAKLRKSRPSRKRRPDSRNRKRQARNRRQKPGKGLRTPVFIEGATNTEAATAYPSEGGQTVLDVPLARPHRRHWAILVSFLIVVLLPFGIATGYLYTRAADQYHSETAFSIRSEEQVSAAAGLLGAITQINPGTASEADILFEYIRSQKIVEDIDAALDLRTIYNRAEGDPVFTLGPDATIEDLLGYWNRMVVVSYESSAGIIHVRANAFRPDDARAIASAILAESSRLVNQLSEQAREDAVRFAREELDEAEVHLRDVRKRLADFRRTNRIVDPSADIAGQMGLLNALQQELAQALVERDVLLSYASEDDQRAIQANRRISAITEQIEEERQNLGVGGVDGVLPEVVGTYEELLVDIEFANTAYTQALAALAAARAEARRQSRYLAPHVRPTYAESPLYPQRVLLSGLTAVFLLLGWGAIMLVYYNVRDNN
jgi:capsular polysaccharide transport system permease protein